MTEKQYRDRWLKQHRQYENIVRVKLTKEFRKLSNNIPFDFLNESNYNVIIRNAIKEDDILSLYYDFYKEIGIIHAKRVGKLLNKQIKEFTVNGFLSVFEKDLLGWLYGNSLSRITSVQQGLILYLQEFIATGIAENKTISELTTDIQNLINRRDFYRWQAMRIARTETTAAANYASTIVSRTSGIVNEKIWISSTDARTRRLPDAEFSHLAMNGVKVGENETFKVPSKFGVEELRFAGDPKGSAGNVINCRCANALVPKRDANGRFIRRNQPINRSVDYSVIRENNIRQYEQTIRNQNYESAGLYDSKGNLIFKKDGTARQVRFEWYELQKMKGNYLTHNHPVEGSFSDSDIHLLAHNGLSEIRAVTKTQTYSMKLNRGAFDKKEYSSLKRTINDLIKKNNKISYNKYIKGEINRHDMLFGTWDNVWKDLATNSKYKKDFTYGIL